MHSTHSTMASTGAASHLDGRSASPLSIATPADRQHRFLGINLGTETVKLVELVRDEGGLRWTRRLVLEHHKEPAACLREALREWDWNGLSGAAVSGRLQRHLSLPQVPARQALARGFRHLAGDIPTTVVSLGSHGFAVLELGMDGREVWRENSRCSQGTGNFLRQLTGRFGLSIEEASRLCASVERPAMLSGRCPVILKTDMTHLANKGEERASILAGLFDAVCENVLVLIKPGRCPSRVVLTGGVARAPRVQSTFRRRLGEMGMTLESLSDDDGLFVEAVGSAVVASSRQSDEAPPAFEALFAPPERTRLAVVPALAEWLPRVKRLPPRASSGDAASPRRLLLGFDIGSTGSKAVALDVLEREVVWEGYRSTSGDPVGAAQALVREFRSAPAGVGTVLGCGVTGSGREIVGSLLSVCHGAPSVYVLNEIAAHAEGARYFDERVDTIFEIGGQDAKYIRLAGGRVVDCAMNEACSAGTGSFIEEQGSKFSGVGNVRRLASAALEAPQGVSLGQHCSVFMAEVIDEAVAAGVGQPAIIAGLYDSIVRNYLHRVKGSRSVGEVIFCQGMPFASDALAAAVARQTGCEVIVPPNPGTIGALGIALLAWREIGWAERNDGVDLQRFLEARVESKDSFRCGAQVGCGAPGNRCPIERLRTIVDGRRQVFTWGGGCGLHDKATRRRKLPDLAPDPFRERETASRAVLAALRSGGGGERVALTDEFSLKGMLPFFATFLHALGCDLVFVGDGDHTDLKRGIQGACVPFCAPMQLHHGVVARMLESGADALFLPMLRSLPRTAAERNAVTCPILQASPDIVRWDRFISASTDGEGGSRRPRLVSPVINVGPGSLASEAFVRSCRETARAFGVVEESRWRGAYEEALRAQESFDRECREIGRRALAFCSSRGIVPVVVLGRPYTIYNTVLNSNVPAILREQGAIGIPVDCYPLADDAPVFDDVYWGQGQRLLRAAHQIRRTPGQASLFCSNYACGPDSFNLHFYAHIMEGRPYAIIETDGHSGDAGTKTRVEAFLHCVEQERRSSDVRLLPAPNDFVAVQVQPVDLRRILEKRDRLLIPWMGYGSEVLAACLRGVGVPAESLPQPGPEDLRRGRRHTSGKECLPMTLTLGGLLGRLERAEPEESFAYLMTSTCGPCRFGVYNLLNRIVLQRIGLSERVRIWSPRDTGYFSDMPHGFAMLVLAGMMAGDLLLEMHDEAASCERVPGAAARLFRERMAALLALVCERAPDTRSLPGSLLEVGRGSLFGIADLLRGAAALNRAISDETLLLPTVLVVGEIYVRCVPFANDSIVEQLRLRGVRARLAPMHEWIEYSEGISRRQRAWYDWSANLSGRIQNSIIATTSRVAEEGMGWQPRATAHASLEAAAPYLRDDLHGEAVLTIGTPLAAWKRGLIQGVVSVGPHECMPNKIAESQLCHATEHEGLPALTLSLNGEPLDAEALDSFAFEVKERYARSSETRAAWAMRTTAAPRGDCCPSGPTRSATTASCLS